MTSPSFSRRLFASLVAGLASGLAVFAAVFLAYYVASGAAIANVPGFVQAFGPSAVVFVVLVVALALLGALANWRRALLAGVGAGVVAPYVGTLVVLVIRGI